MESDFCWCDNHPFFLPFSPFSFSCSFWVTLGDQQCKCTKLNHQAACSTFPSSRCAPTSTNIPQGEWTTRSLSKGWWKLWSYYGKITMGEPCCVGENMQRGCSSGNPHHFPSQLAREQFPLYFLSVCLSLILYPYISPKSSFHHQNRCTL